MSLGANLSVPSYASTFGGGFGPDFPGSTADPSYTVGGDERPAHVPEPKPVLGAMERLERDPELHKKTLERLLDMIRASSQRMSPFYDRWQAAELRVQAYLSSEELEAAYKIANKKGKPPEGITVTVPYSYSTISTIVTYLLHTFCGRKPIFQVGAYRGDAIRRAPLVETLLQFNSDHMRLIRKLFQYFWDGEVYGLQVLRTTWRVDRRLRTVQAQVPVNALIPALGSTTVPQKQEIVTFEGTDITNIDVYNFFPDPRVPFEEVSTRGEYVFWRTFEGRHTLRKAQDAGSLSLVERIPDTSPRGNLWGQSERGRLARGEAVPGMHNGNYAQQSYIQFDQGSVEIVPDEWGLGDSKQVEKWLFAIGNEGQIVQAEPLDCDHDKHPVVVGEPYSMGYSLGNVGIADYLGPFQETLSWLINSHMFNVRAALNNDFVANPQMIDVNDFKQKGPGRVIKMLPAAFGMDPKFALSQLQVGDVTRTHITDMQTVQRIGDMVSSVNDNLRGIHDAGGRKTATEVRTSGEAGASRLAAHARLVSVQSMVPLAEQMTLNYQQKLSQSFYLQVVGDEGLANPIQIGPGEIAGDYTFPIHDGTLPLDRVALLEVWKEIFTTVVASPILAAQYNAGGIFEYLADLGGAKNLKQFKVQAQDPNVIMQQLAAGNLAPMGGQRGAPQL